jgi:nucleotide-binding universal stress UspA family protein
MAGRRWSEAMIERLLVPIDGEGFGERAFGPSLGLARQLGAAITGLIVEPFHSTTPWTDGLLHAHARRVLARFEDSAREAGVPFHGIAVQASEVSDAILEAAGAHRCDMIVMVTHGRGVVSEVLWGSNTRRVMARTRLPVLVLH